MREEASNWWEQAQKDFESIQIGIVNQAVKEGLVVEV